MRALEVVDGAEVVKGVLRLGEIARLLECEHLVLQRAMETLVLAAALRVVGPAVPDRDAELEQPHAQGGPALAARIAPRAAIIDKERLRQPVAAEGELEPALHRAALLVGAGFKAQVVARMVV